jgi:amidase/nitrilase
MDKKRMLRVAAAQITPVFMKKKETVEKYADTIRDAGRQGVDLLVTPETGIPTYPYWRNNFGYTAAGSAELWKETVVDFYQQAVSIPSPETDTLCRAVAAAKLVAVIGLNEQDDRPGSGTLYNTMLFIDRDGQILGRHRKLMPTHQERFFWGRGDASDLRVFDTHFGRLGGLICFENHMTLLKAAMAVKGEEVHAACWPGWWSYGGPGNTVRDMTGSVRPLHLSDQDCAIREYAFETQTFVVSASLYLPDDSVPDSFPFKKTAAWQWAMGGSAIANPFGAYAADPVFHREALVMAEVDLADRIVAKSVFDCMGHYSRWDVVSLQIRDQDFAPAASAPPPRRIRMEQIEAVAERHQLPAEKVENILRELQSMEVEVEG